MQIYFFFQYLQLFSMLPNVKMLLCHDVVIIVKEVIIYPNVQSTTNLAVAEPVSVVTATK